MTGPSSPSNPEFAAFLQLNNHRCARVLEDGTVAALYQILYTTAICTNIGWTGYMGRFCFESADRAWQELQLLQACDDEPAGWIAKR